jgi:D-serine deaminase-like pyridoxal phosphate-dependent protein
LANETSDPALLAWVRDELARDPSFEFYYYLDSPAGTEVAGEFVGGARSAYALVECGHSGGRAGVRRFDQAAEVARAARECGLRVVGVAGYEGMLGEDRSPKAIRRVRAFGVMLRRWLSGLDGEGLLDGQSEHFVISCGGSMYSDVLAPVLARPWALSTPVRAVLRCGSFIVHDHGHYADAGRGGLGANLRPALEIWAQVLSRPEPGLVILGVGRRDVGSDLGLPVVVRSVSPAAALNGTDATVLELHDQHTLIRIAPDHALAVGDVVVFGVSHPSITMDKWPALAVLDDEDRIVGQVTTCYR